MTDQPATLAPERPVTAAALQPVSDSPRHEIAAGLVVALLFFAGFGSWAALARLDSAVLASGVVVVSGQRQTVQHRDGGIVTQLLVQEGDTVSAGQVLLQLDDTELHAQARVLASQVTALQALEARLIAERDGRDALQPPLSFAALDGADRTDAALAMAGQQSQFEVRRRSIETQIDVLEQRIVQLEEQIHGYEAQTRSQQQQLSLIEAELVGTRLLHSQGLTPVTRLRALERAAAELEGRRGEMIAQSARAREAIGETRLQILQVQRQRETEIAEQLREAQLRLFDLVPRLQAVRTTLERTSLRAPAAGAVIGLRVFTEGGVIRAGEPVLDIVPVGRPLVIEAEVRPEDVDDITLGQETEIRFTAFRQRDIPILKGRVLQVSADRLMDQRSGVAFFRAQIEVGEDELTKVAAFHGSPILIRPGMPAEVVIPLRPRTALEYLFEPMATILWLSFREH